MVKKAVCYFERKKFFLGKFLDTLVSEPEHESYIVFESTDSYKKYMQVYIKVYVNFHQSN